MVAAHSLEFCTFLADLTLKSLLLAGFAWAGLKVARVSDANVRHRVWTLVLVAMLALPLLTTMLPNLPAPVWLPSTKTSVVATPPINAAPSRAESTSPASPVVASYAAQPTLASTETPENSTATANESAVPNAPAAAATRNDVPSATLSWSLFVVAIYVSVAALLIGRLILGVALAHRLVRRSRSLAADPRMRSLAAPCPTAVFESNDVQVPLTVGVWRSAILLPHDWTTWSAETLRLVLAHETMHCRRRDAMIALAASLNAAIYWFNPLAWLLRRELASLAEHACDDEVLREHHDRHAYAETLLAMASRLTGGSRVRAPFVAMARQAEVAERIEAIIDHSRPLARRLGIARTAALGIVAAPLIALAAMLGPAATAPAADADEPTAPPSVQDSRDGKEQPQPSAAAAAAPSPRVAGRVVNAADGRPVADAEVRLSGWNESRTNYDTKTAQTDAEGRFTFDVLPPGKLQIIALKGDTASRTSLHKGQQVQAGDEAIELRMRPAPGLQVKVVDRASQKPLEDATVRLTWSDLQRDYPTDAEGNAVIRGLTPETWTLEVFAKGYAEGNEALQLQGVEQTPVTIALDPGFELTGAVVDDQQQPLAGVGISVFPGGHRGQQIEYLITDEQGRYRFAYLPVSGLSLRLSKDGFVDQRPDVAPLVAAGEVQEQDFTMAKRPDGGSITGTVVDDQGQPLAGVQVANGGNSSDQVREATTDAAGRYRLDDVFQGPSGHVAVFKSPGFSPGIVEFTPGTSEEPAVVNVTLAPGHHLRGQVVDEQGTPVAGVYVSRRGFGIPGHDDSDLDVTDDDGRFEFDMLPANSRLDFRKGGFSPIKNAALSLDGDEEILVTLASQGVVRGQVVDAATGENIKTFVVRITFSPDRTPEDPDGSLSGPAVVDDGETFVSDRGAFEIGNFTRGMPLQVTVEAPGYQRQVIRRVVATGADAAKPAEFSLQPIDKWELKTYTGKLVDDGGQGIAGAEVRLIVADRNDRRRDEFPFNWEMIRTGQIADAAPVQQFLSAVTDAEGWFELRDVLPTAEVELVYWGPGIAQRRIAAADKLFGGGRITTITATAAGLVAGTIDEKTFPKVDDVCLMSGQGSFRSEYPLQRGKYLIRDVPPGKYELQVYRNKPIDPNRLDEGFDTEVVHRQPVEVKSRETTEVNLRAKN